MTPSQQHFHDFLMQLVQPGNEAAADAILTQTLAEQGDQPMAPAAIDAATAKLTPLLKPGAAAELQNAADRMKEAAAHAAGDHLHGDHMMHRDAG